MILLHGKSGNRPLFKLLYLRRIYTLLLVYFLKDKNSVSKFLPSKMNSGTLMVIKIGVLSSFSTSSHTSRSPLSQCQRRRRLCENFKTKTIGPTTQYTAIILSLGRLCPTRLGVQKWFISVVLLFFGDFQFSNR